MLELEHASKSYTTPGETIRAVDDVSMTVEAPELVAVFGPSGSGKSTLLSMAAGLVRADRGSVRFEDVDLADLSKKDALAYRREKLGIVFQGFNLTAGFSAVENVEMPLLLRKVDHRQARQRALAALAEVELSGRAEHTTAQLSGGEQQRIAVARALVGEPRLILADEPTGNLDSKSGDLVLELMSALTREHGAAAIVVTHDSGVARFADRVLGMRDGKLVAPELAAFPPAGT